MTDTAPPRARLALATGLSLAAPALAFLAVAQLIAAPRSADGLTDPATLMLAGLLLFAAGFVDWIDGTVARRLGVSGSFGRFLDLHCDAVASAVPPALVLIWLPPRLGGAVLPAWPMVLVALAFVVAVVLRHAIVCERQTTKAVTREDVFRGLVTPPYLHLCAGWLIVLGAGPVLPGTTLDIGALLAANSGVLAGLFALGVVLINTALPYLRAGTLALRSPWPWWLMLGAVALVHPGLGLVAMQLFYILTPLWLRLGLLRAEPYRFGLGRR
ncbi:MAG: CDP-alcohol phosphatidyltransferase family protein [Pseudomonadota bacterium]